MKRLGAVVLMVFVAWAIGACGTQPRPVSPCPDGGCDACVGFTCP